MSDGLFVIGSWRAAAALVSVPAWLAGALIGTSWAQGLPPAAEPSAPLPIERPPTGLTPAPALQIEPTVPGRVPANAESLRFVLQDVRIEGVTAFGADEIAAVYRDLLGQEISVAQFFDIADRITTLYRDAGYVLSRAVVPAQRLEAGTGTIRVVEGYVGEIVIEGEVQRVRPLIERYLDKITTHRPVRIADVERYLLLANDLPGIRVTGVLRPGAELGAAQLVVTATRKPFEGFASVNNRGSDFVGPWTGALGGSANSFTGLGEQTSLLLFGTSSIDEQRYIELDSSFRVGGEGLTFKGFGSYGPSEPGSTLSDLDVESTATRFGFGAEYPLYRTRDRSLWLEGGYEWSLTRSNSDGQKIFRDRLDILEGGARFELADAWGGLTQGRLGLRQGVPLYGTTTKGDDDKSRIDASGVFTALRGELSRRQPIIPHVELFLATEGQYSPDPLLTDAEIKFGGIGSLRGYPPAELSGDSGHAVSVELRLQDAPGVLLAEFVQLYSFYDYGIVWNDGDDEDSSQSLHSAGAGVRWLPAKWLFLELEFAHGFDDQLSGNDAGDKPNKLYFTATASF